MKLKAIYKGSHQKGDSLMIEFEIDKWTCQCLDELSEQEYIVDISTKKQKRSIEQNRYMWALLTEIDEKVNGSRNPWNWYINAIKRTGVKTKIIYMQEESYEELKEMCMNRDGNIRAVESLGMVDDLYAYRLFYGSSKFNTKEMSMLIDIVLDMASLAGLETDEWKELLK